MIKINGRPDTEEIARLIVIKTVNESLVKYHGTRISNDELKELTGYVKGQLEEIIKEVGPKETTIFEDGTDGRQQACRDFFFVVLMLHYPPEIWTASRVRR